MEHALDTLKGQHLAQNRQTAHDRVHDDDLRGPATILARTQHSNVSIMAFDAQAKQHALDQGIVDKKPVWIAGERRRLSEIEKARLQAEFDVGFGGKEGLIAAKMDELRAQREAEELATLEEELVGPRRVIEEGAFDLQHEDNFAELCRLAYEIAREQEGPLEEAAEWDTFLHLRSRRLPQPSAGAPRRAVASSRPATTRGTSPATAACSPATATTSEHLPRQAGDLGCARPCSRSRTASPRRCSPSKGAPPQAR